MADYPPPVEPGDTVAVVAPSHAPPENGLERGVRRLESVFDLDVEVFETAHRDTDWLRDHPEARARDVNRAFRDDTIDGIVAAFGGNREVQILDGLDREILRGNPKRFLGSSDNTHLHLLLNRLGIISFYGGDIFPDLAADSELHRYTREYVERALRAIPFGAVEPATEWTDEYYDLDSGESRKWFPSAGWRWHGDGHATGTVVGGCFSMLESQTMLDQGIFPELLDPGDVLAIETSGETPEPAEIERFFMVLGEGGILDDLGAVLVGRPETPGETPAERESYRCEQRETISRILDEYVADPLAVFDLDFGHAAPVLPLALSARVKVDAERETIRFPNRRI